MKIEQIYTGCLAQAAYLIESEGQIAIIDPLRETQPYLDRISQLNGNLKFVFETHFHADFVSGHLDLAKKTGAEIVYGPLAKAQYKMKNAEDGEVFKLGKIQIIALHTPGHTMESTTWLLKDEMGKDHAIFTGDTLFLGDVGRPDLAVKSDLTQEDLAKKLYHSLYNKIMPLADEVIVYPGHGAGSACGKNMSKETVGLLGEQKKTNYALQNLSEEEFVKQVTNGLANPPQYFPKNAMLNKMGYDEFEKILNTGSQALDPIEFERIANESGALVIDTRNAQVFAKAFVPKSINIGIGGKFASWVGTLITDLTQPILLICDPGTEEEAITRLARVGYDHTIGYLKGGFSSWEKAGKEMDSILSLTARDFAEKQISSEQILDVRNNNEYRSQHLTHPAVLNFPLDTINANMEKISADQSYYIHCAGGYRSMIAASILKARGFHKVFDIAGGFNALKETELVTSEYVCPTSLL